jgi:protein involved in polysaccharide export with SLBB domain
MVTSSKVCHFLVVLAVLFAIAQTASWCDGSKLAVGDVISVVVDGEKDLTKPYQVNNDGYISMSMIDPVKVAGLNTSDASAVITKALGKVLVSPQVTVQFVERARMQVFVVGQVLKKGLVEVGVGDCVLQALAQAVYDDTADLSHVDIRRGDEIISLDMTKYLSGEDLTLNRELQSGDTIVVQRVDMLGTALVTGYVGKPGTLPIKRGMTFREAMGLIGDVTLDADTERITIKRQGTTDPIKVSYDAAMAGDPAADVALQPGDTINVPQLEVSSFTVMGGVNRPGQYPIKGRLTLSEAIGTAGGAMPNVGDLRYVTIMHAGTKDLASAQAATIDLTKVIAGSAQEPLVRRGDVISVKVHKPGLNLLQMLQSVLPFGWLFRR